MSKLFTEAECLHIVAVASGRTPCLPPAENSPVFSLAASAVAGQGGGTYRPLFTSRAHPLAMQLTEPCGFWASASHGRFGADYCRRFPALRSAK